jgi:hypothetical protein
MQQNMQKNIFGKDVAPLKFPQAKSLSEIFASNHFNQNNQSNQVKRKFGHITTSNASRHKIINTNPFSNKCNGLACKLFTKDYPIFEINKTSNPFYNTSTSLLHGHIPANKFDLKDTTVEYFAPHQDIEFDIQSSYNISNGVPYFGLFKSYPTFSVSAESNDQPSLTLKQDLDELLKINKKNIHSIIGMSASNFASGDVINYIHTSYENNGHKYVSYVYTNDVAMKHVKIYLDYQKNSGYFECLLTEDQFNKIKENRSMFDKEITLNAQFDFVQKLFNVPIRKSPFDKRIELNAVTCVRLIDIVGWNNAMGFKNMSYEEKNGFVILTTKIEEMNMMDYLVPSDEASHAKKRRTN